MKQYMVVETFKPTCWALARGRFEQKRRLLPTGLNYLGSWSNRDRRLCYQLMETAQPKLFTLWFSRWDDLVEFDLVPLD